MPLTSIQLAVVKRYLNRYRYRLNLYITVENGRPERRDDTLTGTPLPFPVEEHHPLKCLIVRMLWDRRLWARQAMVQINL